MQGFPDKLLLLWPLSEGISVACCAKEAMQALGKL